MKLFQQHKPRIASTGARHLLLGRNREPEQSPYILKFGIRSSDHERNGNHDFMRRIDEQAS